MAVTRRQDEVGRLFVAGLKAQEISRQLGVSVSTVRRHLRSLMSKFGAHGPAELRERLR